MSPKIVPYTATFISTRLRSHPDDVDTLARIIEREPHADRRMGASHMTLLMIEARKLHVNTMRYLLEQGADVNANDVNGQNEPSGHSVLHEVLGARDSRGTNLEPKRAKALALLDEYGVTLESKNPLAGSLWTPALGRNAAMDWLWDHDYSVHTIDLQGQTLVHALAERWDTLDELYFVEHQSWLSEALARGARLDVPDGQGMTAQQIVDLNLDPAEIVGDQRARRSAWDAVVNADTLKTDLDQTMEGLTMPSVRRPRL